MICQGLQLSKKGYRRLLKNQSELSSPNQLQAITEPQSKLLSENNKTSMKVPSKSQSKKHQ